MDRGRTLAKIELPIARLMSDEPLHKVEVKKVSKLRDAFAKMRVIDHPYMPIPCLLTLSVIPYVRITDRGIYNLDSRKFVTHFVKIILHMCSN